MNEGSLSVPIARVRQLMTVQVNHGRVMLGIARDWARYVSGDWQELRGDT